jgi:hypothetical protein
MRIVIDWDGCEVDYDSAVALMDDDVREVLHAALAPCSEQDFFDAYLIAHYVKYGEVFTV